MYKENKVSIKSILLLCLLVIVSISAQAAPQNFPQAKNEARQYIYHDRNKNAGGDLYCGCDWKWVGRSGGRVELESCGYKIRKQPVRAKRTEWEHIVPASNFGRARQCWQNGGRKNCTSNDPVFSKMEADLHNLAPAVGEINADRQNYNFGYVETSAADYGSCDFKIDFKGRTAEPTDEIKGMVARVYFYMHDRYDLPMSRQQQRLFIQWDKQYPPNAWEIERDKRIAQRMGHSNPFVTKEAKWELGHKNSKEGLNVGNVQSTPVADTSQSEQQTQGEIRGNRNSKVYHLPKGCPSYNRVSPQNIIPFKSEAEAQSAGYRKAKNCTP